jgi:hypothetical protein
MSVEEKNENINILYLIYYTIIVKDYKLGIGWNIISQYKILWLKSQNKRLSLRLLFLI